MQQISDVLFALIYPGIPTCEYLKKSFIFFTITKDAVSYVATPSVPNVSANIRLNVTSDTLKIRTELRPSFAAQLAIALSFENLSFLIPFNTELKSLLVTFKKLLLPHISSNGRIRVGAHILYLYSPGCSLRRVYNNIQCLFSFHCTSCT